MTHGDADFTFSPYKRDIGMKPKTESHLSPVSRYLGEQLDNPLESDRYAGDLAEWGLKDFRDRLEGPVNGTIVGRLLVWPM